MITDNAARAIVTEGWANETGGSVEASTGHFALLTIEPNEVDEVRGAISEMLADPSQTVEPGNYVIVENDQGFVTVLDYGTPQAARDYFTLLTEEYSRWCDIEADGHEHTPSCPC